MKPQAKTPRAARLLAVMTVVLIACTETATGPQIPAPLRGLASVASRDSAGNTPPPPPGGDATPGYVRGTVLGPSLPGAGNDSLLTAPKVIGGRIAAFPIIGGTTAAPELGPEATFTTTGADGKFTLPMIPGGVYVVTISPPAGSIYGGVWVTATIHDQSHLFPWWVVLWAK